MLACTQIPINKVQNTLNKDTCLVRILICVKGNLASLTSASVYMPSSGYGSVKIADS
jgi:hypothetical protein